MLCHRTYTDSHNYQQTSLVLADHYKEYASLIVWGSLYPLPESFAYYPVSYSCCMLRCKVNV